MAFNKTLVQQAIADAKLIQNIALEDAKKQLAQAFTPRIKQMLSNKIKDIQNQSDEQQIAQQGVNPKVNQLQDDQDSIAQSAYQNDDIDLNQLVREIQQDTKQQKPEQQKELVQQKKEKEVKQEQPEVLDVDEQGQIDLSDIIDDDQSADAVQTTNDDQDINLDIEDDDQPIGQTEPVNTEDDHDIDLDLDDSTDISKQQTPQSDQDVDINITDDDRAVNINVADDQDINFDDLDDQPQKDKQLQFAQKEIKKLQRQNKQIKLENQKLIKQNKNYEQAIQYLKYKMDQTKLANHKIGLVTKLFESKA